MVSDAEFYCGWGKECNEIAVTGIGYSVITWYYVTRDSARQQVAAEFTGECLAEGCLIETWWRPPSDDEAGSAVSVAATNGARIHECFCGGFPLQPITFDCLIL